MQQERLPLVALVGRPNVGKSSLFNRLTRSRKAIIDPQPGVTRDRQYEKVVWDDRMFTLIDTGGIEPGSRDAMGSHIQEQTWQAVEDADVILFMLDGIEGLVSEDYDIAEMLRKSDKPVYYLVNKIDGPKAEADRMPQFYEMGVSQLWPVSAAHGYGVSDFMDHLAENLTMPPDHKNLPDDTIRLACIGRPNVGKSSLVNRLLGEERMVVSDIPGTTRDAVSTLLEKDGRHFLLIDTAGIRRKGKVRSRVEKFSVMNALASLERCDIALILIDASEGITDQDATVIGYSLDRGRACMVLINKWDLVRDDEKRQKWLMDEFVRATRFVGFAPALNISALTGSGVNRIFPALYRTFEQFCQKFSTSRLNRLLEKAVEDHAPPMHMGRRLKFYYSTQVGVKPPAFIIFVNYPDDVHFSYYRYLVNQYRTGLGLDYSPLRIIFKERKRKKYG